MGNVPVGIAGVSIFSPDKIETAAEIAAASGIPEQVLTDKFGIKQKRIAGAGEHVTDMCIAAARPLFDILDAADVDAVCYFGSHFKDFGVWQAAPDIQEALGIEGFSFEAINVSAGAPVVLKIVSDMLTADSNLRSILIVGASRESHLVDYSNERSRFTYNFGDGSVAALLRRGLAENQVLSSSIITDGSFAGHVKVPAGGSVNPTSRATLDAGLHALDVEDPGEMKRRLDPITIKNFVRVATESVERSGAELSDIDFLLPIHMKRSIHDAILLELGLDQTQAVYLDEYGHMSAVDPLFSLALARDSGRLADGDLVLLLAAGTGYTWAATAVRWGKS